MRNYNIGGINMNKIVELIKKPVVWIATSIVCVIGVAVGLMVKFKDKIFD